MGWHLFDLFRIKRRLDLPASSAGVAGYFYKRAEARVREMWENGEVVIGQSDFAGIMISSGG